MKGVLKVTKEQVLEVERYCDEHKITRSQRIEELGLSRTAYYYTRSLLSDEELYGGTFLPISASSSWGSTPSCRGKKSSRAVSVPSEPMTIELRLPSGTEMRLMGNFAPEMLKAIIGNV